MLIIRILLIVLENYIERKELKDILEEMHLIVWEVLVAPPVWSYLMNFNHILKKGIEGTINNNTHKY